MRYEGKLYKKTELDSLQFGFLRKAKMISCWVLQHQTNIEIYRVHLGLVNLI